MIENTEEYRRLRERADEFKGDKALFWAGQMATHAATLERANPLALSRLLDMLFFCREQYDHVIFTRVK